MPRHTYRVISRDVFLNCTLGGFAEPDESRGLAARMYRAGRAVSDIVTLTEIPRRTLYRRLHEAGVNFRREFNAFGTSTAIEAF